MKSKKENKTGGINTSTINGIDQEGIIEIVKSLKNEQFKFKKDKLILIYKDKDKDNGGQRHVVPQTSKFNITYNRDKIVQESIRMILEIIFEPTFSDVSHGFRKGRSCQSAFKHVKVNFDSST
jgi:retron-type reverse transcriptase